MKINLLTKWIPISYSMYSMFLLNFVNIYAGSSAMTFKGGGRLGDKLIVYCKTKWFSHKLNIPFLCPDFPLKNKKLFG